MAKALGSKTEHQGFASARSFPGVFPPEVQLQATGLAASPPRQKGKPLVRRSAAEIARCLITLDISVGTVGRWLVQERIGPWRYHTWQHVLDPEAFLARAKPVCGSMSQRKSSRERAGTN